MSLAVLSVAYPFAPVSPDPVGGAEQVLACLDRALVERGHRSIVIAAEGSSVAGELVPVPQVKDLIGPEQKARTHAAVRERIASVLSREGVDVVHLHGIDFAEYLPPPGPPVLVTLHLPLDWYPEAALRPERPRTFLHPVSASQAASAPSGTALGGPIENGVRSIPGATRKRGFALALGRICPEKGLEDALDACRRAEVPLLIAGAVFPYPEHEAHFRERIAPRLDRRRRWIGPVAGAAKDRLLAQARCVLIPSRARETSSLVAMEALAAGTPVIAYRTGALPDIVEHGRTGFVVEDVAGLADALGAVSRIKPDLCRLRARERFSADRMSRAYLSRYAELAAA